MVRASVSLQLHGRTRKGQEIGKRGAEKEREREKEELAVQPAVS